MQFVKETDDLGKTIVRLDLEGLKLPVDYDADSLCKFRIDTYQVLKPNASDFQWMLTFGLVNTFLQTLNEEEQVLFASMIMAMHYRIIEEMSTKQQLDGDKLVALEIELSQMLAAFDQQVNLLPKLVDFTDKNIYIQSFAGVGERAQDSVAMTFYRDDVVRLTATALLCKLMTVIFGTFIEACKKKMDNSYKEIHCVSILKNILDNRCPDLIEKTIYYIDRIIKPILNKSEYTSIYNGFTNNSVVQYIFSHIFARRFVQVNLLKEDSNLMKYITSCARAAANTQFSLSGFRTSAMPIKLPTEDSAATDDGNVSNLEVESKSSNKTADFQLLIKAAVWSICDRFPIEYNLDTELLEHVQNFHEYSHIPLTPVNSYILGIVFGDALGGAKSVEMLDGMSLNKLVPVLQLYLYQQGFIDLVHAVTLVNTGAAKGFPSGIDTQLRTTWNNSFEYRNCDQMFPYIVNGIKWDTGLKTIMDAITTEVYTYNTAPVLWEKLETEILNGATFVTPENLCRSICALISQTQG